MKGFESMTGCAHSHHDHSRHDHAHAPVPAKPAAEACGCSGNPVFDGVDPRYRRILWVVIALNAVMFLVEIVSGHLARSQALQADALDFLGDTLTYGLSLAVIGASLRTRSLAAMAKGVSLFLMETSAKAWFGVAARADL